MTGPTLSESIRSSVFQFGEKLQEENLGNGMRRQIFGFNDQIMMVKVFFDRGAIGQVHEHFHAQVTYVESGVFEVMIGAEKKLLKAGDGFFVPPHALHGCLCLEAGVLIDVFAPKREDFISSK